MLEPLHEGSGRNYTGDARIALACDAIVLHKGPTFRNQSWTSALKNTAETLDVLARRIDDDWRKTPKVLWKPLTVELFTRRHRVSAIFQRAMRILKGRLPEATYEAERAMLQDRFSEGLLDENFIEPLSPGLFFCVFVFQKYFRILLI